MNSKQSSGSRTLLWSVIMSSPGPIVVGLGLLVGRSATQVADFVRRSAELMAIIVSFIVYRMTTENGLTDMQKKALLERRTNLFVGAAMCLGGAMMFLLALLPSKGESGNVIPGLCIAVMGVIANAIFWRRYRRLGLEGGNSILLVQSRLYRAKTLVDGCVTLALASVALFPQAGFSLLLDKAGSAVVALYLLYTGVRTILDARKAA